MDPSFLLALVMIAALTAYVLLAGADFGGGVWDLLASGPTARAQRDTIAHAIAPVWEANHVWLIFVVTVLFNAFPPVFARVSIGLHIPLSLMLLGIVLRGSAFVFRAYGVTADRKAETTTAAWGRIFAVASLVTPLVIGATVGAITQGRLHGGGETFAATYIAPWTTAFAIAVGAFALSVFAYLAAVYLTLEARDVEVAEAFRSRALASGVVVGAMALAVFVLSGNAPHVRAALSASAWAASLHVATGGCALSAFWLLWTRHYWWARAAAAAQVSLIVWGWALAQYPYLVRPDLTIAATAAPRSVLIVLLWILAAGALILLPSLWYLFRIFAPVRSTRRRQP